jgi:hypothetical protein
MMTAKEYAVSVTRMVTPIPALMARKIRDIRWLVVIWRTMNSAIIMATINHQGQSAIRSSPGAIRDWREVLDVSDCSVDIDNCLAEKWIDGKRPAGIIIPAGLD